MDSTELARRRRRARWAYEWGRLRLALLGMAPVWLVMLGAACITHRPMSTVVFGLVTVVTGATLLWVGGEAQKAVLPGVLAGLLPLTLALCANQMHVCGSDSCSSLCVPACGIGGTLAGLLVANVGQRRHLGRRFWMPASALAVLTGAMGCACIGYSGVLGLAGGFGLGLLPGLLRHLRSRPSA